MDEKEGVKVTFADNGIGIPDNLQKDIYNIFFRAASASSGRNYIFRLPSK